MLRYSWRRNVGKRKSAMFDVVRWKRIGVAVLVSAGEDAGVSVFGVFTFAVGVVDSMVAVSSCGVAVSILGLIWFTRGTPTAMRSFEHGKRASVMRTD
jgi:hypothetical protein